FPISLIWARLGKLRGRTLPQPNSLRYAGSAGGGVHPYPMLVTRNHARPFAEDRSYYAAAACQMQLKRAPLDDLLCRQSLKDRSPIAGDSRLDDALHVPLKEVALRREL